MSVSVTASRSTAGLRDGSGRPVHTAKAETIVNGGPQLVRDGRDEITQARDGFVHPGDPSFAYGFVVKRNPRTFAGVDAQGRTVLVTVDGRTTADLGLSIPETADVARSLGLVDAINLDGGGSTAMAVNGALVTHPSDSGRRASGRRRDRGDAGPLTRPGGASVRTGQCDPGGRTDLRRAVPGW